MSHSSSFDIGRLVDGDGFEEEDGSAQDAAVAAADIEASGSTAVPRQGELGDPSDGALGAVAVDNRRRR